MSKTLTTNYALGNWEDGDNPGATDLNFNWTTIDEQVYNRDLEIQTLDADVQVDVNALSGDVLVKRVSTKTAAYSVIISDNRTYFTNSGAGGQVIFTLPPATVVGERHGFIVLTAQNIRISPGNATDTIRVAASASTASTGHIDNATIGGVVMLLCVAVGSWIAVNQEGTWTVA